MQNDSNINGRLDALQASVNSIAEMLIKMQKEKTAFGNWVSEKETMMITGLSRSTLLKLRKEGKLRSSTLCGKSIFYRIEDFKKLLELNQETMK